MADNLDVTQEGEVFGKPAHRSLKIERCENGYLVKYKAVVEPDPNAVGRYTNLIEKTRVFLTNTDLLEFVEKYFKGEPRP
jgi:hypothetical protein